jgi:hypothetical protein
VLLSVIAEHLCIPSQVMPVHASRMLPGSEQIATNMAQLMAAFDPAKPLTFQVRGDVLKAVQQQQQQHHEQQQQQ